MFRAVLGDGICVGERDLALLIPAQGHLQRSLAFGDDGLRLGESAAFRQIERSVAAFGMLYSHRARAFQMDVNNAAGRILAVFMHDILVVADIRLLISICIGVRICISVCISVGVSICISIGVRISVRIGVCIRVGVRISIRVGIGVCIRVSI